MFGVLSGRYFFLEIKRKGTIVSMKYKTPLQAIKQYCFECVGNSYKERELCDMENCLLHPFRLGKSLKRKKSKIEKLSKKSKIRGS